MAPLNDWPWRHWARTQPQVTALMLGEQPLSWLALQSQVDELAADFQHQGVEPGCGVALCGKNSYPLLLAYLALLQCGARLLPLNPALPTPLLAQLLPELDMTFVFGPDSLPPLPEEVIRLTPPSTEPRWPDLPTWDAQRLATLTLTSGSSGMPKAAAHSYANHLASAAGVLELMAFQREDCWLLSLPLFHVSGQGIVWRWLAAGARLAVREMHPLNEALAGCTHASLVPTQLWRLLAQPLAGMTLKAVLLGGAMIPVELTERAEEAGIRCWCGYGLTELASTVCAKRRCAAGRWPAARRPRIKLVDEEVWIRAESLALGYWRHGHLQPLADEQGWFATRDRGAMAEGNCVFSAGWKTCSSAAVKGCSRRISNACWRRIRRSRRRLWCRWRMPSSASGRWR